MEFQVVQIATDYVIIKDLKTARTERIEKYKKYEKWTLMDIMAGNNRELIAVFENHKDERGSIVYINEKEIICKLVKSLESTKTAKESSYWEQMFKEIQANARDFLAEQVLAGEDDPCYETVANCLPPIGRIENWRTGEERIITFVGSQNCIDKVGIFYGGITHTFNSIALAPEIRRIIQKGQVWEGLVGGWLPVLRFRYPLRKGSYWEMLVFAEVKTSSPWIQPVWYRLVKCKNETVEKVEYCRSYLSSRGKVRGEVFYKELIKIWKEWNNILKPAMKLDLPEKRVLSFCRHSLIRAMITRVDDHPKYGVFDKQYGGSEHDGFPDTYTSSVSSFLEWRLFEITRRYLENYLEEFVEKDGSINYRGPEIGQYGRMLALFAQYYNYTEDETVFLKHIEKIRGIEELLLSLREKAKQLPSQDPAYGMISGWSEADSFIFPEPERYDQPYFSNSTETCRGFYDLGRVWVKIGQKLSKSELINRGQKLIREAEELRKDILSSVQRSLLKDRDPVCLPAIAGVKRSYDEDINEDPLCPQQFASRAYCEMLHSGILPASIIEIITKYNSLHGGSILGIPGFPGGGWLGGPSHTNRSFLPFLAYRYAYGLIQNGKIKEFLLLYYALMAHCYTRGTWTAFEFGTMQTGRRTLVPYCVPAQLGIPILTKWMLVFEDPDLAILRLGQAIPRKWLEKGKRILVQNAPTRWGKIDYEITSKIDEGKIIVAIELPRSNFAAEVILHLRAPQKQRIKKVLVNKKGWSEFDSNKETISLPAGLKGEISLEVKYEKI